MLNVRLLGSFIVQLDGRRLEIPSRPAQLLFIYLVLHRGVPVRREKLAALLWADSAEKQARSNLRHALWRLRQTFRDVNPIEAEVIESTDELITFDAARETDIDVSLLERRAQAQESLEDLIASVEVYRGELLPGFYDNRIVLERQRVTAVFEAKMGALMNRILADGGWRQAVEWAERWIGFGGAPEPAFRAPMIAHSHLDDHSAAAAAYERCVQSLRQELDALPSEATRQLYERIMAGEKPPPLAVDRPSDDIIAGVGGEEPPAPGDAPYRGLRYFDPADANLFFGRERLVDQLVLRLSRLLEPGARSPRLMAVVGASGSGKSSLLRAGLIPAMSQVGSRRPGRSAHLALGSLKPYLLTPTAHPLDILAMELTRDSETVDAAIALKEGMAAESGTLFMHLLRKVPGGEAGGFSAAHEATPLSLESDTEQKPMLLIVDQFEELFTLCLDESERKAFVENLTTAAGPGGPVLAVIALRADFYAHCGAYPSLRTALERQQIYIGRMSREELARAIQGPAAQGAWAFEPGLVEFLLDEIGEEPGSLPLLSHALLETWRRRQGRTMSFAGYYAAGGVRGSIARTADRTLEGLDPGEREIARRIFTRLTQLGESTQDTRRRVELDELAVEGEDREVVEHVLAELADARLITKSATSIEVAHEVLIREWPTLRTWLDADRAALKIHQHLTRSAQSWERLNRDAGELYGGARLAQAVEWSQVHGGDMSRLEREFLEASVKLVKEREEEREAQRQRELEAAHALAQAERQRAEQQALRSAEQALASRRFRRLAAWLGLLFLVAVGLAAVTLRQTRMALRQTQIAVARELAGAALANLEVDPERSILLALEAAGETRSSDGAVLPEAVDALHQALQASRVKVTLKPAGGGAFSPDGSLIATGGSDELARIWDAEGGELLILLAGHSAQVMNVAFSPDGGRLVTASLDGTARIWDLATGKAVLVLEGHTDGLVSPAYSPDGKQIVTTSYDGTARLWNAQTGEQEFVLHHSGTTAGPHFSPDGSLVAIADVDAAVARIWDTRTGEEVMTLAGHEEGVNEVAFSPDGSKLATAGSDFLVKLWDAMSGAEVQSLEGHTGWVFSVEFTPDGRYVVSGSQDGTAKVWDVASGKEIMTLAGHLGGVGEVAVSPDGGLVLTGGQDGTARLWDIRPEGSRDWLTLAGHTDVALEVTVSPDGDSAATASWDGTVRIWDLASGGSRVLEGHTDQVGGVTFSPDGSILASAGYDGTIRIWDTSSAGELSILDGHMGIVTGVAFSPDGKVLATGGEDGTARIWDPDTGEEIRTLLGHKDWVFRVAFSPDGSQLATASWDGTAKVWDVDTGRELQTLVGHGDAVTSVEYSPDGTQLVTSSFDGEARIWDLNGALDSSADPGSPTSRILSGHNGIVWDATFSPDGKTIATASFDGTVKIWNAQTGQELLSLKAPSSVAFANVDFSPDGRLLFASTDDGTVRIFLLPVDELIELARGRVTRDLTDAECRQYLHIETCQVAHSGGLE